MALGLALDAKIFPFDHVHVIHIFLHRWMKDKERSSDARSLFARHRNLLRTAEKLLTGEEKEKRIDFYPY